MRKRSSYKPRGVRLDNMAYVKTSLTPITALVDDNFVLRTRNHAAMLAMVNGTADRATVEGLMGSINMAEALMGIGKGRDWAEEIHAGHEAIKAMGKRGAARGRFLFTGPELTAVNLAMQIHDAQLDDATLQDLERAIKIVNTTIANKRAEKIVETA